MTLTEQDVLSVLQSNTREILTGGRGKPRVKDHHSLRAYEILEEIGIEKFYGFTKRVNQIVELLRRRGHVIAKDRGYRYVGYKDTAGRHE